MAKEGGLQAIVSVMDSCGKSATVQIAAFHALRNIVCRNCKFSPIAQEFLICTISYHLNVYIFER